jgi:RecA/RadA recombinase
MHLQTGKLLEHYSHLALFRKINEECKTIVNQLGIKIRAKMVKREVLIIIFLL